MPIENHSALTVRLRASPFSTRDFQVMPSFLAMPRAMEAMPAGRQDDDRQMPMPSHAHHGRAKVNSSTKVSMMSLEV